MSVEENMLEDYYISVASHEEFTRDDIVIEYQPSERFTHFAYTIIKDGKRLETVPVEDNDLYVISLTETGQYKIEFVNYTDNEEEGQTFETGIYNIDKEAPRLEFSKDSYQIEAGTTFDLLSGVRATDGQDGNLTSKIATNADEIDFSTPGKKEVTFTVEDGAGNRTVKTVTFEVVESRRTEIFLTQCVIIGVVALVIIMILRYYRTILLEKRIAKFSLEPEDETNNFFDRLAKIKDGLVSAITRPISKFNWVVYYSKYYEKYQIAFRKKNSVDIISEKIWMSILFLAVSILASTLRLEVLSVVEMILAFFIGFILVDIIYFIRYRFYRNHVENDLLQAIIVMNNAFRSGHSIPQAIEIVAHELDGEIHEEFSRMHKELSMGLSVEETFRRFSERVDISEVTYLTSSLSILNRTGGNIMKVFSSIEKTLMRKKKMRLELKALTASAKLVSYLLMLLPAIFVLIVSFVSPDYFLPLVDNLIGWFVLVLIIAVYLLYIYVVRQIMKVRM